jgi:hypothetical protein
MSNIGAQKTSTKQNQQFNEILVNTTRTRELLGFLDNDLIISSNNQNNQNNQNNIILNKNICINSSGELIISKNLQFLDINSLENPLSLYNDENNLIWGNDVIITDSTLQSEIESLNLNKIFIKEIEFTNQNQNLNQNSNSNSYSNKDIPRIVLNIPKDFSVSYNLTLPNQKPKNNQIMSYSSNNDTLNWVDLPSKIPTATSTPTPIGSIVLFSKNKDIKIPKGWLLCDGSELFSHEYPKLYSIIGSNYGKGYYDKHYQNYSFKLPDLLSDLNENAFPVNKNLVYIICCE